MRHMTRAMRVWLFAFLAAVLATPGCRDQSTTSKSNSVPATIKVGHAGHDHQLALYVAALEGERFRQRGCPYLREVKQFEIYDLVEGEKVLARLQFIKMGGGSNIPAALSRGEIDIGFGGVTSAAKFADEGQPFKIICPLQTDGDMLVMHKDSPVTDWASFVAAARSGPRPLRIGYKAPMAVAKAVFEGGLLAEGVSFGPSLDEGQTGVIMVNFGSEKGPIPLLDSKSLDGFVMNQPGPALAVNKGVGKIICHLRDLPPAGKWIDHPCCCVMTREQTIASSPEAIKALLKTIHLGTREIRDNVELGIDCAHRWAKYPLEVEKASVPTVTYVSEPSETWIEGLKTWLPIAQSQNYFTGKYKQASGEQFVQDLCSLDLCRQAAAELRDKGLLK